MKKKNKHIILFDGDCSFCNFWVRFITKRDVKKQFVFHSLQSDIGRKLRQEHYISEELDTLIYINDKNNAYIKSGAALRVAKRLKFPWFLFFGFIIIPPFIRNWLYDVIAKNRHKLFKNNSCEIPFD